MLLINPTDTGNARCLVPYGVDAWTGQALGGAAAFPFAEIDPQSAAPLRFNTLAYDDGVMKALRGADPGDAVSGYLRRLCAPWDQAARRFLDHYRNALDAIVAAEHRKVGDRTRTFDGLFQPRDWLFSAPIPLPRAHLAAPEAAGFQAVRATDFVAVDFAFWLGAQWIAVVRPAATPRRTAERDERLRRAGIAVVGWDASLLAEPPAPFLQRLFAPLPDDFWLDQRLPCGPFRPATLRG